MRKKEGLGRTERVSKGTMKTQGRERERGRAASGREREGLKMANEKRKGDKKEEL